MPISRAKRFFQLEHFVVVGASRDQHKFGNKVLRCYKEQGLPVTAVNNKIENSSGREEIEGMPTVASLTAFVESIAGSSTTLVPAITCVGVSIITPPAVTRVVLEEGVALGITHFFLQPGTTDASVKAYMKRVKASHKEVSILEGCVLVELGFVGYLGEDF
jgi:predicted CoA-binding protein